MKRAIVVCLLAVLTACVGTPEPWKPDVSTDTASDSQARNADGKGEVGVGDVKWPDAADVKVVDVIDVVDIVALPEVVDTVVTLDIKDVSPEAGEVTPDVPDVTPDAADSIDAGEVCDAECGGVCGDCDDGMICVKGSCYLDYCSFGLGSLGCCFEGVLLWCTDGKLEKTDCPSNPSPYDTCGWDAGEYDCGGEGEDPAGLLPQACCVPDCADKECDPDGCWGSCGECGLNEECSDGKCDCVADSLLCDGVCCLAGEVCAEDGCCTPDCGGKDCGDDGCGGNCGECADALDCTVDGCKDDLCVFTPENACVIGGDCYAAADKGADLCLGCVPGSSTSDWTALQNGTTCGDNAECQAGVCGCIAEECSDGCCGVGAVCHNDLCCTPDCNGKVCGDDGCGGSCGGCNGCGEECVDGACEFTNCDGKSCGPNGCGGSCGSCTGPQDECLGGACVCQSDCDGRDCGDDGCGGSCGACPGGESCQAGQCEMVCGDGQCAAGEEDQCNCPGDCTGGCAGCCSGTECKTGDTLSYCGSVGEVCDECSGGEVCQGAHCVCAPEDHQECADGDVYWFDSCGVEGEKFEECGEYSCAFAACLPPSCGDSFCNGTETQCSCAQDCGGCPGCCSDTVCKAGMLKSECGKNGVPCESCASGKACQCQTCSIGWKDCTSGLTWENPPAVITMDWSSAKQYCADLSLDGGGWHLPTIKELRSLLRGCPATETGGSCNVQEGVCLKKSCMDPSCEGCSQNGGPAPGGYYWPDEMQGPSARYWSSSPVEDFVKPPTSPGNPGWGIHFTYGDVAASTDVSYINRARCVR